MRASRAFFPVDPASFPPPLERSSQLIVELVVAGRACGSSQLDRSEDRIHHDADSDIGRYRRFVAGQIVKLAPFHCRDCINSFSQQGRQCPEWMKVSAAEKKIL